MTESDIITIKGLTKRFGNFTAVNNMDLHIRKGEIFGFLGPNGAGKTTTISMLTTLIAPTAGSAHIAGFDLKKDGDHIRSVIGVVPQTFALFPELTALENLEYIGKLYGMHSRQIKERTDYLLKKVALYDHRNRIAGVFSGGMKQRLSLAASIMSNPQILFMDEPTTGLDPQSRIAIRELTQDLNKQGMTVVYTTHDMEEAEKICDRIVIMDKGKIIIDGTAAELKQSIMSGHILEVRTQQSPSERTLKELAQFPFIKKQTINQNTIHLTVDNKEGVFFKVSDFFHSRKIPIEEIQFKEPTLEEVFVTLTKKDLRD